MLSWKRIFVPAMAALGLLACNQPDPTTVSPEGASGSARVALPELPSGYLAGAAQAVLYLDVTGPGMTPIRIATPLNEGKAGVVDVKGIPPGKPRVFHGLLVRIDGSKADTTATHEGSDTTSIQAGLVADVHLFLKAKGLGGAHVCLDVEGWPSNPACVKPPIPQPGIPKVGGCYALEVTKHGPKEDTVFKGNLSIQQKDSMLFGVVTWPSGARDTATGQVYPGNVVYLGNAPAQFSIKAIYDTTKGLLFGAYFYSTKRGISGEAIAAPVSCDPVIVPPKDTLKIDSLACWSVEQKTTDGRAMKGSLWVAWRGAALQGLFQWDWNGASFTVDNGNVPIGGGALYLFGVLPGGFGHQSVSAIERAHYKAKIFGGALNTGAAYAKAGAGDWAGEDKFADWSGKPLACPEKAAIYLAGQFK